MKKLIEFIKTKEQGEKNQATASSKKSVSKAEKIQAPNPENSQPRDIFWDDYSDIGYC